MMRKFSQALALALVLGAASGFGADPAAAEGCLSAGDARAAVAGGRAIPLSSVLASIRAAVPGDIVSQQLCEFGGRLVYLVDVYSRVSASTTHVQIDAQTGSINY
jgi:uncharacterized membrane protein YkoI